MDRAKKVETAIRLLKHCDQTDDQDGADLLIGVIASDRLWQECSNDAGEPFRSMDEFAAELQDELAPAGVGTGNRPTASARRFAGHQPPRMTPQQRYEQRQARNRGLRA